MTVPYDKCTSQFRYFCIRKFSILSEWESTEHQRKIQILAFWCFNLYIWCYKQYLSETIQAILTWNITNDSRQHNFKNETSRRINRNLWNNLTIDADMQTDFKIVKTQSKSDIIWTRSVWDHWISSIPERPQIGQFNDLVSAIMRANMPPKKAVRRLNHYFSMINNYFSLSRGSSICFFTLIVTFLTFFL